MEEATKVALSGPEGDSDWDTPIEMWIVPGEITLGSSVSIDSDCRGVQLTFRAEVPALVSKCGKSEF